MSLTISIYSLVAFFVQFKGILGRPYTLYIHLLMDLPVGMPGYIFTPPTLLLIGGNRYRGWHCCNGKLQLLSSSRASLSAPRTALSSRATP